MIRKSLCLSLYTGLALVAMLTLTTSWSATDAPEASSPAELPGGQCRVPLVGDITRSAA